MHLHTHRHTLNLKSINHKVHNALKVDLDDAELLNLFRLTLWSNQNKVGHFVAYFPPLLSAAATKW